MIAKLLRFYAWLCVTDTPARWPRPGVPFVYGTSIPYCGGTDSPHAFKRAIMDDKPPSLRSVKP
jgi:hypothetical protein